MHLHRPRRAAVAAAAAALALPVTVVGVPASAAVLGPALPIAARTVPLDAHGLPWGPPTSSGPWAYDPYAGLEGVPYYGPSAGSTTATTTGEDATAAQSRGLALVSTELDFGAGEAAGSGIVLSSDGLVVTNHHVVADSTHIEVTVAATGTTYTARVVGTDSERDVALLDLRGATGLATADLSAAGVTRGQAVTAVGDAGGDGGSLTAAAGTVTRLAKSISVQADDGTTSHLRRLIEVAAEVVPGDSGGALLDSDGKVVGMNVAASSGSSTISGYVIPVVRVERVVAKVLAGDDSGAVDLGYDAFLGVSLTSDGTIAGVLRDGPAADAGLAAGDTVTAVDGTQVATRVQVRRAITAHHPGDTVAVSWSDVAGASHVAEVRLARAPVA